MLDLNEKAKSPIGPIEKVPFLLLTVAMLLLLTNPSPIDPERDEHHPRIEHHPKIDQKRDNDDTNNPRISAENSAQLKEKQEDNSCCKHSIIVEIQYNQMRYFLSDDWQFTYFHKAWKGKRNNNLYFVSLFVLNINGSACL